LADQFIYVHEDEYDPVDCITAGELRASGVAIPSDVPDCGWVPRASIKQSIADDCSVTPDGRFNATIEIQFTVAFRWVEMDCTVDPPVQEEP